LTDLDITADDNLAYSHSIQRVAGTDKQGKKPDRQSVQPRRRPE
jgi:hypothetical protein